MTEIADDAELLEIVRGAAPASVKDVIAVMQQIETALPDSDGLKWFNRLYLMVTEKVDEASGWVDPGWLLELDVVFAGYYFRALKDWLEDAAEVPVAWRDLMQARRRPGIDRIQFALAGMNAHINHDLALALIETQGVVGNGNLAARRQDYETVNALLAAVEPGALGMLATDVLGDIAEDAGTPGRVIGMWNVRAARELAWAFHLELQRLEGLAKTAALEAQAVATGVIGRALLVSTANIESLRL